MTPQLDMFQPLARTSDPMPSHVAAAEMLGSVKRETECAAILDALRTSFLPLTYREVAVRLKGRIREAVEVERRLHDLRVAKARHERRDAAVSGVWTARADLEGGSVKALIAWSVVLTLCGAVGYRIVTNPETRHPVTAGVIVAVLILSGVYLALDEHFGPDEDARYQKRVMRDMAKNLEDRQ